VYPSAISRLGPSGDRDRRADLAATRSVSDIAGELGFSQQTHFTRFFRQYKGVPPREFRRRAYAAGHPYEKRNAVNKIQFGKIALGLG